MSTGLEIKLSDYEREVDTHVYTIKACEENPIIADCSNAHFLTHKVVPTYTWSHTHDMRGRSMLHVLI